MRKLMILSPIHAAMVFSVSVLFLASCGGDDSPTAPGGEEPRPRETAVLEGHKA